MRAAVDTKTADLLPDHDLAGERPAKPSRLDKMRERRGLTANLPSALVDEFHAMRQKRGHTVNEAIEKLLRTQYLRKR